jgi:hypothetical protein
MRGASCTKPETCVVCGQPVFGTDEPVCMDAECRQVAGHKRIMPTSSYRHYFHGRAAGIRQRVERERIEKEKRAELRRRTEKAYFARVRALIADDLGEAANRRPSIRVPRNYRRTAALAKDRKDDFRNFLTTLVHQTLNDAGARRQDGDAADSPRYDSLQNAFPGEALLCRKHNK